ncbi:hypothetical protein SELMODRAFT_429560 [Selaginella moellendorffii]|uniref:Endonuclease/exonuclease/phosphatase domain-containing protein n=1 Tax=Selaginella moellendorffii TaxID=88036 RepID=D8T6K5_SELML|nr:hypothetical protein SELMODRAFT_429560 [Selaginella moellendorffii]
MELQQRQVLEAKTLVLAIFEGGKPDRELAMQWLDECFQEVGVAFRGRQPTYECFFYRYPLGFSPSQKETIHQPTMELDLIIDDLSKTNNTPVFLAMMVEGLCSTWGKKPLRRNQADSSSMSCSQVYLVHIVESRTTPTTTPAPSTQVESRKCKRSPATRTGTSRRPPGRDSVYHTGRSHGWRASPIRSSGWGADPSAQRLPSPTQPQLERLPEVNTQPHAKESASRSSQRLQVRLWMHVSTSRPRRYLAVWRGSPTGCTLPSFHMARNQLPDQGLHVFLQASEIINDISYRVEVDKCTIVGSNMDLGIQRRLDRFYLTMDLCMQGGKLDIYNTYTDFSDHHPIRLTLPFRRSRGPRKPVAIPKKFFEEQANNNRAHEQWEKHKGNIHSFTLQIAQEAQAKIRKDRRGVFNTVQKVRRILTSINTDLCSNPDDQWLQAQKIQVKHQLERIEADKMEAFLKAGHIRWHASELVLNKEFYRSIRSKVVSPPMFGLKDEQGQLHTEIDDMHNMAEHYHSQLFKEEPWDEVRQEKLERVLEHIPTKYTPAMNTRLMRLFTL